jgi:hypothetical protein
MGKKYQVVDQPGPDVMKVQVAILDAEAATPGMRSISMAVPQLRLLTTATSLGTEKFPFAGGAEAAAKITDSVTGQLLGAGVDRRMGASSMRAAAQWQWGDAENAIKAWAELMATQLCRHTSGARNHRGRTVSARRTVETVTQGSSGWEMGLLGGDTIATIGDQQIAVGSDVLPSVDCMPLGPEDNVEKIRHARRQDPVAPARGSRRPPAEVPGPDAGLSSSPRLSP